MAITISSDKSPEARQAIEDGLTAFNRASLGSDFPFENLTLAVRDDEGAIIGGLVGNIYIDTLHISILWLDEKLRGQGIGKTLMAEMEGEGRTKGARYASLSTLSWQARPFYESLGWKVLGEMPVLGGAHKRYYMWKAL